MISDEEHGFDARPFVQPQDSVFSHVPSGAFSLRLVHELNERLFFQFKSFMDATDESKSPQQDPRARSSASKNSAGLFQLLCRILLLLL